RGEVWVRVLPGVSLPCGPFQKSGPSTEHHLETFKKRQKEMRRLERQKVVLLGHREMSRASCHPAHSKSHAEVHSKRNRIRARPTLRPVEPNRQDGLHKKGLEQAAAVFDRPTLIQEGCESELCGVYVKRQAGAGRKAMPKRKQ